MLPRINWLNYQGMGPRELQAELNGMIEDMMHARSCAMDDSVICIALASCCRVCGLAGLAVNLRADAEGE